MRTIAVKPRDEIRFVEAKGARVPSLGIGTWQMEGADCVRAVADALGIGYRHVDTAQGYGNEAEVGEALAVSGVPREDVFVTTKLWVEGLDRRSVLAAVERSLVGLETEWIDLLLVHWPSPTTPIEETLETMRLVRDEGKVRHLGVSNFPPSLLARALAVAPILCNQVEYHPYLSQDRLLDLAREHDLFLTAYCPLAQGRVARDPALGAIARRYGKTPAQVVLRWLVQQDRVAAIPRAADPVHRRENFEIWDFELPDDEMEAIRALDTGLRLLDPDFAPDWER